MVKINGDNTFEASVSFGGDGETTMPNDPGGGRSSGDIVDKIRNPPRRVAFP